MYILIYLGIIETKQGIETLSNKPAMEFLPIMQIYAKLLTQHSLTDMKEYDNLIKVQAPNSGEEAENAIEAFWTAEENYENLLKKVNRVLNLQVPKTIRSVQVHCHQYFGDVVSKYIPSNVSW